MVVIDAFRDALSILREQPVLFVPMALFALLQAPQLLANTLDPLVSIAVSLGLTAVFAFVTPLFYAGTIGMANDAASGRGTSLARFWTQAKANYLSVLAAYLVVLGVSVVASIAIGFGSSVAFAAVLGADAGLGATVAVGAVVAVVVLLYLIGMFALQFYAHAIVIEGYDAMAALSRSVGVVRRNVLPVLGYGVLSGVFGGLVGAVYGLLVVVLFPPSAPGEPLAMPGTTTAIVGAAVAFVATAILGTLFLAFSVTLYRSLVGADETASGAGATGTTRRSDDGAEFAG